MNALNIEIFSDLVCPWCHIGRRRLEAGLKILGANELPNIFWRPFELNPDMPKAGLDRSSGAGNARKPWIVKLRRSAGGSGWSLITIGY